MNNSFLSRMYMSSIVAAFTITLLVIGKTILIPLTIALFFSLGLYPLVQRLRRFGIPQLPSIIITFIVGFAVMGAIGYTIGFAVSDFAEKLPSYQEASQDNIEHIRNTVLDKFSWTEEQFDARVNTYLPSVGYTVARGLVTASANIAGTLGLTIVFTFLMLVYRDRIKKFFQMVADNNQQDEIDVIAQKSFKILPRYILGLVEVIAIMAVLNSLGFWLIGVPSPIFWGIIVATLNVIPYVGTIIGFGGVVLFSLAVAGPTVGLLAIGMFLLIQFLDNNFLTPVITGGQININPLAAIVAIIVWGMIWGIVGMVLALPILGLIKIVCESVPFFRPIAYLIGDKNQLTINH